MDVDVLRLGGESLRPVLRRTRAWDANPFERPGSEHCPTFRGVMEINYPRGRQVSRPPSAHDTRTFHPAHLLSHRTLLLRPRCERRAIRRQTTGMDDMQSPAPLPRSRPLPVRSESVSGHQIRA
jgi:hypothetical protein